MAIPEFFAPPGRGDSKRVRRTAADVIVALLVIVTHLTVALLGANYLASHRIFTLLGISGAEFFRQLFITGVFLYALFFAFRYLGFVASRGASMIAGIFALSLAFSILLGADAYQPLATTADPAVRDAPPDSFAGLFYTLLTKHQALLALTLITVGGVALGTYYIFRSLFAIEYSGSGLQIRLPGHQVVYLPVYPQISWQNTKIVLKKDEKVAIELYGYVSPGALLTIPEAAQQQKALTDWIKGGSKPEEYAAMVQSQSPTWPYTGPEGYKEEWYSSQKLDVFKTHPIYKEDNYFQDDSGLTVRGLPHNAVIGIIRAVGQSPPKEAKAGNPAYSWSKSEDQEMLLYLSSDSYPMSIEVPKSGELWVVINDVDEARWDNAGMFFLKVTRHAWL